MYFCGVQICFSAQIRFPVRKIIFQYTNMFQCTNKFPSAQMFFSAQIIPGTQWAKNGRQTLGLDCAQFHCNYKKPSLIDRV